MALWQIKERLMILSTFCLSNLILLLLARASLQFTVQLWVVGAYLEGRGLQYSFVFKSTTFDRQP